LVRWLVGSLVCLFVWFGLVCLFVCLLNVCKREYGI
jgi:hypothetical protein